MEVSSPFTSNYYFVGDDDDGDDDGGGGGKEGALDTESSCELN